MSTQSGCTTRTSVVTDAVATCQVSSGPVGPHQRDGTLDTDTGTVRSSAGFGQCALQLLPSHAAKGMMMPSRRSMPTPNRSLGVSAAAERLIAAAAVKAAARSVLMVTTEEYTRPL